MTPRNRFKEFFKGSEEQRRMFSFFINTKQTVGLLFLFLAFTTFSLVAYSGGDAGRVIVMLYGLVVLGMAMGSIFHYIAKTVLLQNDKTVARYVAINTVNTFVGLLVPLFVLNEVVRVLMNLASQITNYSTFFCQIRCSVVEYYWRSDIYTNVNTLLFWSVVILFGYWLVGGFVERYLQKK